MTISEKPKNIETNILKQPLLNDTLKYISHILHNQPPLILPIKPGTKSQNPLIYVSKTPNPRVSTIRQNLTPCR